MIEVNGAAVEAPRDETPLLHFLREALGLAGTRFGCGAEQCGACLVLVDGEPRYSCTLPAASVDGRRVTTIEGLARDGRPHPVQAALLAEQAGQCGYCLPGIALRAAALLDAHPQPTEAQVRAALDAHLCRCGSHNRIVRAVLRAARAC